MSVPSDAIARTLTDHFRENRSRFALGEALRVTAKLNWGGFVNRHFEVGDGSTRYHVKLSSDVETLSGLRRWHALAPELEARYRAPKIVSWIDLPAASLSGLVLQHLPGPSLEPHASPGVLRQVLALAERLHADDSLAEALRRDGLDRGARASVVAHYVDHLEADLIESGERYPVDKGMLDWMHAELRAVRRLFEEDESFDGVRSTPIHGDLWSENVIVAHDERTWHVVDWDDLTLGDPVVDFATLLWPVLRDRGDPSTWLGEKARDESFTARLELCLRAALLDEIIDPLADWVEAEQLPEHTERVRTVKRRVHERAYDLYRGKY